MRRKSPRRAHAFGHSGLFDLELLTHTSFPPPRTEPSPSAMAAENLGLAAAQRPEQHDHPPPALIPTSDDPDLDPAIRHLLDQQAEIQAKLAALLPRKHGLDIKAELQMLRHKLQVLEAYADNNRKPSSHVTIIRCGFFEACSPAEYVIPRANCAAIVLWLSFLFLAVLRGDWP